MRVLITRPRAEAEALAQFLRARGIESTIEPLLEIEPIATPAPSLDGVAALLFTSANGARAFAAVESRRDLPVYAIGARTAEVAREAGFANVESADGDVAALAALVRRKVDPASGALLHGAGAAVKGDLAAMLAPDGFEVRRVTLYEAVPAKALSSAVVAALRDGSLDAVLLFSDRSAVTFILLVRSAGVEETCARLIAFCLSPSVAEAASAVRWRAVRTASRPEQAALLDLLASSTFPSGVEDPAPMNKADSVTDAKDNKPEDAAETQATRVIRAFGGIRPMAAKLGVPVTTVQGWKERGTIPEPRVAEVLAAAAKQGVSLSDLDLKTDLNGKLQAPDEIAAASPETPPPKPTPEVRTAIPSIASRGTVEDAPVREPTPAANQQQANQSTKEAPPPSAVRRPIGSRAVATALWAAAFAGLILAGTLSLPYWASLVGLEPPADRSTAVSDREVQALRTRLETLESRIAAPQPEATAGASAELSAKTAELGSEVGAIERRIRALEASLGDLVNRPEPKPGADPEKLAGLADQTASLGQRVAALEVLTKKSNEATERRVALVLAVGQLRDALSRKTSYDKALAAVVALAEGDAALAGPLAELKAHAATGIATRTDLTSRFDAVALAAARASAEPAGSSWTDEALARLSRLFVVRRVNGDVSGEGADAVLARAGARIDAGDLAGAVTQLTGLSGRAADAVKPWLEEAKARLAADLALDEIGSYAIKHLDEGRS